MLLVVRVVVSVGSTPPKNKLKGKGNRFRFHIYVVTFFRALQGFLTPTKLSKGKGMVGPMSGLYPWLKISHVI